MKRYPFLATRTGQIALPAILCCLNLLCIRYWQVPTPICWTGVGLQVLVSCLILRYR